MVEIISIGRITMSKYRYVSLLAVLAVVSGCATSSKNPQADAYYAKENALRKAYKDCLARNGKDASKCAKEKDALYEQMEWNLMQESN
jgi:4-alpha-glucanotransferase